MRPLLHDAHLDEELRTQGFVIVPFLDAEELASFAAEVDAMRPDDGFTPTGEESSNLSTYHCTFLDTSTAYKREANEAIRRVFQPRIDQVVREFRILTSNLYVKPPGRGRFEIHQNWPTLDDLSQTSLTVWCPLQDVDVDNGTIHVVPGSHKITPDVSTPAEPPYFQHFENALVERYLEPVTLRAGQALVFDDSLVHWSPENSSATPRRAVQIETVPAEAKPVLYHLDQTGTEARFELFEVGFDFYVDHSIAEVIGRPTMLRSLGHRLSANRAMNEEEFSARLDQGARIRDHVYRTGRWPVDLVAEPN